MNGVAVVCFIIIQSQIHRTMSSSIFTTHWKWISVVRNAWVFIWFFIFIFPFSMPFYTKCVKPCNMFMKIYRTTHIYTDLVSEYSTIIFSHINNVFFLLFRMFFWSFVLSRICIGRNIFTIHRQKSLPA